MNYQDKILTETRRMYLHNAKDTTYTLNGNKFQLDPLVDIGWEEVETSDVYYACFSAMQTMVTVARAVALEEMRLAAEHREL